MNPKKQIGQRIRELRKKRGLTQEKAATMAGITGKHLSSIELGKENPTLNTLINLSAVLEVELWELLNYGHELSIKELQREVSAYFKTSKYEDLRLVLKFINTISN
ncbi:MAG: hypothetical protein A2077_02915 [Nitrospirae bacterium GWC2_46_6]|nr:MAG: hypothetical protein A2077_02915 [Nitrospirae bacterium GWC2_46_6]OGW21705.1 MAG: hypothetical protein A2Z82_03645 [Nitrospirae bacterium GWA2_46_11]OGW23621.1 MAG: hypothetical protein A2X55_03300 [Nitrospirae bacterium GWB2_47_37]